MSTRELRDRVAALEGVFAPLEAGPPYIAVRVCNGRRGGGMLPDDTITAARIDRVTMPRAAGESVASLCLRVAAACPRPRDAVPVIMFTYSR